MGNIFHQPANADRTMIAISGKSKDIVITNNIFNARGRALSVEPGATGVVTSNNQYTGKETRSPGAHR